MGMDRAKSLLPVHDGLTFLDVIARQVLALREQFGVPLPLLMMNSFRTSRDTMEALGAYPELPVGELPLEFLQNREPKLLASDLTPVDWPADPDLEWCPPGHGDVYSALVGSGALDALLAAGFRFAFVSNSDNLGARPDPRLAAWFADSGSPLGAEYIRRTPADRKGGHLARRKADGSLVLRESAQTRPEDAGAFGDIGRHRYFNSNSLWLDLDALKATMAANGGVLPLPIIRNVKNVDPTDSASPEVVQIETAMGAAISVFDGAIAIEVERARFLPVKATSDLLVMRSDAYELTDRCELRLIDGRTDAPLVTLDQPYKLIADFDERFPAGPPSLAAADSLVVKGDWTFGADVTVRGTAVVDAAGSPGRIPDGAVLSGDADRETTTG